MSEVKNPPMSATASCAKDPASRRAKDDFLLKTKLETSAPFFRDTKVLSCSKVLYRNGEAIAVGFPLKKTGYMAPGSYANISKSSELTSFSQ